MTAAWALVPAGGTGTRFSASEDKLEAPLAGVPVLIRTLNALLAASSIQGIVVAAHPERLAAYRAMAGAASKPIVWVPGGATRRMSVWQALQALPDEVDVVAVQDAARPLVAPELVDEAITALRVSNAAGIVVGQPVSDTLKRVSVDEGCNPLIKTTVARDELWSVQTPQVFWRAMLSQAHQDVASDANVTDDAQLIELAGLGPVRLLASFAPNVKITTAHDIRRAEALLAVQ